MSRAIGMLETYGLVAAVEGLDAAIKSANVSVRSFEYVSGGLIAWFVEGDVGAVRVAVAAGKAAASRVGDVVSDHVIARVAEGVGDTLPQPKRPGGRKGDTGIQRRDYQVKTKQPKPNKTGPVVPVVKKAPEPAPEPAPAPGFEPIHVPEPVSEPAPVQEPATDNVSTSKVYSHDDLQPLGVYDLRAIARQTGGIGLTKTEIRDARKNVLIKAILEAREKTGG